jgi:hypothetical protein
MLAVFVELLFRWWLKWVMRFNPQDDSIMLVGYCKIGVTSEQHTLTAACSDQKLITPDG